MKKYYLKGTNKELRFGDEFRAHVAGSIDENALEMLQNLGIIEVKDFAEDEDDDEDYDLIEELTNLCKNYEDMELRMEKLEETVEKLCSIVFSKKKASKHSK